MTSGSREPGGVSAASAGRERLVQATIVRERPSAIYEVLLGSQHSVLAHLVANEKRNFVRLLPGDKVEVELSPHDPTRGRVVRLIRKATGE